MEVPSLNTLLGCHNLLKVNNQRNKKPSSKIDWNNFAHQIYDYHFVVFMMQILLAIELTNKGELGKNGEIMEEEVSFRAERWLTYEKDYEGGFWGIS